MPIIIALGIVLGLGSGVALLASSASAHPFALVLLIASVPLVAAGVLGQSARDSKVNLPALAFVGLVGSLAVTFGSIALMLTAVFALLPSLVVVAVLAPILLAWPHPHDEEAAGHPESGGVAHFGGAGLTPAAAGHPRGS